MGAQFLDRTDIMIGQALLLKYKPVNLDVLPLYIVLVLAAPAVECQRGIFAAVSC